MFSWLQLLLMTTLARYEAPSIGDYYYDTWGNVIGWLIASISFVPIPVVAIYKLAKAKGTLMQVCPFFFFF